MQHRIRKDRHSGKLLTFRCLVRLFALTIKVSMTRTGAFTSLILNADQLVVFDINRRQVVANLDGFSRVHGVWAVPELGRVYASVTGKHQVAVVDMKTLQTLAQVGPINYPDGLAYAPTANRGFRL
jgi:DNA-binding beta-propeller fold protein YncE